MTRREPRGWSELEDLGTWGKGSTFVSFVRTPTFPVNDRQLRLVKIT